MPPMSPENPSPALLPEPSFDAIPDTLRCPVLVPDDEAPPTLPAPPPEPSIPPPPPSAVRIHT